MSTRSCYRPWISRKATEDGIKGVDTKVTTLTGYMGWQVKSIIGLVVGRDRHASLREGRDAPVNRFAPPTRRRAVLRPRPRDPHPPGPRRPDVWARRQRRVLPGPHRVRRVRGRAGLRPLAAPVRLSPQLGRPPRGRRRRARPGLGRDHPPQAVQLRSDLECHQLQVDGHLLRPGLPAGPRRGVATPAGALRARLPDPRPAWPPGPATLRVNLRGECPGNYLDNWAPVSIDMPPVQFEVVERGGKP